MADQQVSPPSRREKRGGYSGTQAGASMKPPQKVPSGFIKPIKPAPAQPAKP